MAKKKYYIRRETIYEYYQVEATSKIEAAKMSIDNPYCVETKSTKIYFKL